MFTDMLSCICELKQLSKRLFIFRRLNATKIRFVRLSICPSICPLSGWSVCWLVGLSIVFYFSDDFISLTLLLLPKWSSDLQYGPCPPPPNLESRESGPVHV